MSASAKANKLGKKPIKQRAQLPQELPELLGPPQKTSTEQILKGYKHQLIVTDQRLINLLYQQAGCRRFLYNYFLKLHTKMWQEEGKGLTKKQASALLTELKKEPEYLWLNNVAAQPLQQALQDLYTAFDRFFKGIGNYPKPKKRQAGDSFRLPSPQKIRIRIQYGKTGKPYYQVYLQKLGWYNLTNCYQEQLGIALYAGELRSATISRSGNNWYISFACRVKKPAVQDLNKPAVQDLNKPILEDLNEPVASKLSGVNSNLNKQSIGNQAANDRALDEQSVGIDRGVKISMAFSDGSVFHTVNQDQTGEGKVARRRHAVSQYRIKEYQRQLARQELGSNNRQKTKDKLRKEYKRIANRKLDRIHQQTKLLTSQYSLIIIEDLKVKQMMKSAKRTIDNPGTNIAQKRGLNRVIGQQSWGEMTRQLEYKSSWSNGQLISVPAAYTSRTCSACGYQSKKNRKSQAVFSCISCGHTENADTNAGKVIKQLGIKQVQALTGLQALVKPKALNTQQALTKAQELATRQALTKAQELATQQELAMQENAIMTGGTSAQAFLEQALSDSLELAPFGSRLDNGSQEKSKPLSALNQAVSKRNTNQTLGKKENKTLASKRRRQTPKSTQDE